MKNFNVQLAIYYTCADLSMSLGGWKNPTKNYLTYLIEITLWRTWIEVLGVLDEFFVFFPFSFLSSLCTKYLSVFKFYKTYFSISLHTISPLNILGNSRVKRQLSCTNIRIVFFLNQTTQHAMGISPSYDIKNS